MKSLEIGFENYHHGIIPFLWFNIKQSLWFLRRKAYKQALINFFDFQMDDNLIFIHFIIMQIYIHRTTRHLDESGKK